MKNFIKEKIELIKLVVLCILLLLVSSWDFVDIHLHRSDYTKVTAEIVDIQKESYTAYRKGRRRRRNKYYVSVKYFYKGRLHYASKLDKKLGEEEGDHIYIYVHSDGTVKRGNLDLGVAVIFIIIIVMAIIKKIKENDGYTPIPSYPRGMIVDDFDDISYNDNLIAETEKSEHKIQSQQKEENVQEMRTIEIPEKYL